MVSPTGQFRRGRNTRSNSQTPSSSIVRRMKRTRNFKFRLRENWGALQCQNDLTSAFLNVDGLSEAKRLDVADFVAQENPDFFVLLETKRRKEELASDIHDVSEVRRSNTAGDKKGGGIAYYTRNTGGVLFRKHSPNIEHGDLAYVTSERVWVTVESLQCKTAICSVYLGCQYPDDRHQAWNEGIYWVLRQEAIELRAAGYRLQFLGDFNGHVGDSVEHGVPGNNPDINKNGERFIDFLFSCDLRHVNGALKVPGDPASRICSGLWTRQRGNSRSVIDFVGMSAEHMDTVLSMKVDDTGAYGGGSDHNWSWIKVADKFRNLVRAKGSVKKENVWNFSDDQDWSGYKAAVDHNLPVDDLTTLGVDDLAASLVSALREGGLAAFGYKRVIKKLSMKSRSMPRHIVAECELKRQMEARWKTLSSVAVPDIEAVEAAENAFEEQAAKVDDIFQYRRVVTRAKVRKQCSGKTPAAKKRFWGFVTGKVKQSSDISAVVSSTGVLKCKPDEIGVEVEKHLCEVFEGSMDSLVPATPVPSGQCEHSYSSSLPPPSSISDHSYAKDPSPKLPRVGDSDDIAKNPNNWLAKDFSFKELKKIAAALNSGKARGWDNIPAEFIKNAPDSAFVVLTFLFNKIKNSGTFPKGWNCGRITLVHKKGERSKLGNYRPITVLISLSSYFSKVLNERLMEVVETHNLLGEAQNGFRKGRCGADNIFLLNTILWKARAEGVKVHVGFVDVQKAYDSVNRRILWSKLETLGIGGAFLQTLKAMYFDDSIRCTVNGVTTRSVYLQRGLRQGCSLSPILFALYILGIGEALSTSSDGFSVGNVSISGLLFADDIILVSKTAAGLKRLFRLVKAHCDALLLVINTGEGKSEVISPQDEVWDLFDDEGSLELSLRQVLEYKYLGLEMTGSVLKTLRNKQAKCLKIATKYKFACLSLGKSGPDVVDVSLATWSNLAIPSILFGCESVIFKEANIIAVERVQSQVAKCVLGVPSNTANICAQTELGLLPFRHLLYKMQLQFYFRVLDLPQSRWVKQAMLEHLSMDWPSPYLDNITSIRSALQLHFVPPTPRYLSVHVAQWSLAAVNTALENLSLPYVGTLTSFKRQLYVFEHPHLDTVAAFRLSNAGLGNRHPRFATADYVRRVSCPLCTSSSLTEGHVVFFCPSVEQFRRDLDLSLFRTVCQSKGFSEEKTFSLYVNGHDWKGNPLVGVDFASRGLVMDTIRGHWLSCW